MIPQFCTYELRFAWKPLKVEPVTVSQQLVFSFTNAEYLLPYIIKAYYYLPSYVDRIHSYFSKVA